LIFLDHNNGVHWVCAIYDENNNSVVHYNSFHNSIKNHFKNVIDLSLRELDKKNFTYLEYQYPKINFQTNGVDCGFFVLKFIENYLVNKPAEFSQDDLQEIRIEMVLNLFQYFNIGDYKDSRSFYLSNYSNDLNK
jgi:Ulp1 family protease